MGSSRQGAGSSPFRIKLPPAMEARVYAALRRAIADPRVGRDLSRRAAVILARHGQDLR